MNATMKRRRTNAARRSWALPARAGFTLVELLLVLTIIGLLLAIGFPAVHSAIETARRVKCASNLDDIGNGLAAYQHVKDHYPVGNVPVKNWTFQASLLPYLGRSDLYEQIDFEPRRCFDTNRRADGKGVPSVAISVMQCPSDPRRGESWHDDFWGTYATGNYYGVIGTTAKKKDGMLFSGRPVRDSQISDGNRNTIFVGERPNVSDLLYGWWACGSGEDFDGNGDNLLTAEVGLTHGGNGDEHRFHFWSNHPQGANFLFADYTVRWLSYDIDYHTFLRMASRSGDDDASSVEPLALADVASPISPGAGIP
jgi:prepilin-type N-terminal cleavage/methylation domain-containing protein